MLIESSIPTDIFENYNITPALRRDLNDLGFTFRLFTRVNPRRYFSFFVEEMNQWVLEHIREGNLKKDTLTSSENTMVAIDFRPRPPFDFSNYPDDEELLGPFLSKCRKEGRIPKVIPYYGNKTKCVHLPPDSRIGLSIPEIRGLILPALKESLVLQVDLPKESTVRLPFFRECTEMIISENPYREVFDETVIPEETEMSWLSNQEVGKGTGEWCEDGFFDERKPDRQRGNLYIGRTEGDMWTVRWWSSAKEDSGKRSIITGRLNDELQRLPKLGFRPLIEFPQVIDSSQR